MASLVKKFANGFCLRGDYRSSIFGLLVSRTFLSDGYGQNRNVELIMEPPAGQPELAMQSLHIDQCMERDLPITSLMLDRLFRSITTAEHVSGMKYYLHKHRHSENGYFLHPWTQYVFTQKCFEYHPDTFFEVTKDKPQYGIFPHFTICNQMLDKYLEENNLKDACKVVNEIFLLEFLEHKTTQTLVLRAMSMYWNQNKNEESLLPEFEDLQMKRNFAATLYVIGKYISNPSLRLLGSALLGSMQKENGHLSVLKDPWGPLEGKKYMEEALMELEQLKEPVSKQSVDVILQCIGDDEEVKPKVAENIERLQQEDLIKSNELDLQQLSDQLIGQLEQFEDEEAKMFESEVSTWLEERRVLLEVEADLIKRKKEDRDRFFTMTNIEKEAHEKAVAKLGYYFFSRNPNKYKNRKQRTKNIHYREDYVDGCMADLELLEGYRKKLNIKKDPIIYLGLLYRQEKASVLGDVF